MVFVVCRLQEMRKRQGVPILLALYRPLRKTYDSADRTLLWVILQRFGVAPSMLSVICQFHGGMRSYVRTGDER